MIDVDGSESGTDEERKPVFGGVRCGDQRCERLYSRIRARLRLSLLRRRKDQAVDGEALALPQSFIAGEEMRAIPANGTAKGRPKIVPSEGRLSHGRSVEKIPGVHRAIAQEIEKLAVKVIRARACGDVDDGARVSAVFGAVGGVVDFELGYRVDGRLEGDLVLNHIIEVDAVHQVVDGIFALARGDEAERSLAAQGSRQEPVLGRSYGSRGKQAQIHEVAPVERDFLRRFLVNDLPHGNGAGIDYGSFHLDADLFADLANLQLDVLRYCGGRV